MSTISIEMPCHCFDVLLSRLNKKPLPAVPPSIPNANFPLFVTWKKGAREDLRGCIGTFSTNLPLHKGLTEYAQQSAFHDGRFDPIGAHEIPQLSCGVSLLVKFEAARDYRDWTVPSSCRRWPPITAGIKRKRWTACCRRAASPGPIREADRMGARVERFQSEKMNVTYQDYLAYKKRTALKN
ncbi:AMMECR1 domain-containing protein [Aphelenchoides fujianensis]|nr:AMMECR1 domain-containing protein [Aphelenchoides fujianensis]